MKKGLVSGLGLLLAAGTAWAQQYLITTVAGGGAPLTPARAVGASLPFLSAIAADGLGNVYFSAAPWVFKVDAAGVLTRVAGSALSGSSGDGGQAISAKVAGVSGLATDAAGNLYIADGIAAVRKVSAATGIITTVAGNGHIGYTGDGGPSTSAQLFDPQAVAVDAAGNLYISDTGNKVVRKVTAATGVITTVAAQLDYPYGVAVDAAGNLYIADTAANVVLKVAANGAITTFAGNGSASSSGDGGLATSAQLYNPAALAVDVAGNLYTVENTNKIRMVASATGIITTVAGNGTPGYSGDDGPATSAELQTPRGVAVDTAGNVYISDSNNSVIRKVAAATGIITTIAGNGAYAYSGDGGPATSAQLPWPVGVAVNRAGDLYITDVMNQVLRKVAANGTITTVAGKGASYPDLRGWGLAFDAAGNLYIADENSVVRKLDAATGIITTVAGNGTFGSSGDGGPALSAQLKEPVGVAVDAEGNLYIADVQSCVIRKVAAATGIITTVAGNGVSGYTGDAGAATSAEFEAPQSVAVDAAGNLYVADITSNVVRKVTAATGIITTVAGIGHKGHYWGYSGDGGPATNAYLNSPYGVAVDGAGNLFIADSQNYVVRQVSATTGIITTIGGSGSLGSLGDGGPATKASLSEPFGLTVDAARRIYVAAGNRVRLLVPAGTNPLLSVALARPANVFAQGQAGATYSVVVRNAAGAGPSAGTVTLTETVPAGLALVSLSGPGWNCSGATCTRDDALAGGAGYPPVTVTVNVAADAPAQVTNQATISGGGSGPAGASDLIIVVSGPPAPPVLTFPSNGAIGVVTAPTLVWEASPGAVAYDVYFGPSSPPPLVTSTAATSYAPGPSDPGATYYWQIVARNNAGAASSATWSFSTGATAAGLQFVPVTPCRVVDTRDGWFDGALTRNSTRSFAIPQSGCGIPATAQAYSLNVTVVPRGPLGFLTVWPTGQTRPPVSTLNSWDGRVVANAAIVPAGEGGAVSVYVTNPTDVVLDIDGYFDSPHALSSYAFYSATPCRVADTRWATGLFGGPMMGAEESRGFPIPLSSCAIPPAASAYSLNVTVVPEGPLSYLTTWPTGQAPPLVSTLNSWTGKVVANAAIVRAGSNDSISVLVTNPTDVILDINGYFGQAGGTRALSFYPVAPCRVADTRNAEGPFGGPEMEAQSTRSFAIPASACNIPSTAAAYSLNVTALPDGPLSYLTAWPAGSPQPFVSTLNSLDGTVVANAAIVPAGTNGAISIFVTNTAHVILDINGYFAP